MSVRRSLKVDAEFGDVGAGTATEETIGSF